MIVLDRASALRKAMPELEDWALATKKRSSYRVTIERPGPDESGVLHASYTGDSHQHEAGAAILEVLRGFYERHPGAASERLIIFALPVHR